MHREEARGARGALELRALLGHEQMPHEPLAVLLEHALHALGFEHVDADAVNHRAARIRSFMSRTAFGSPSNTARAMMAWPMFSSTISRIAAIGSTL